MSCNEYDIENELEYKSKVNMIDGVALFGAIACLIYLISIA